MVPGQLDLSVPSALLVLKESQARQDIKDLLDHLDLLAPQVNLTKYRLIKHRPIKNRYTSHQLTVCQCLSPVTSPQQLVMVKNINFKS